jgi:SsrA-binding protein
MELKNRSAFHEYHIEDTYDAGIVLTGTEVKSLREGKASFNDAYCFIHRSEVWVKSFHISVYAFGTYANHDPVRERKLLLTKKEIRKIEGKMKEKGFTLIPLRVWFSENGHAKMQIGLARGKKLHDKRESIKQKDSDREMKRYLKR